MKLLIKPISVILLLFFLFFLNLTIVNSNAQDIPEKAQSMMKAKLFRAVKGYGTLIIIKQLLDEGADVNTKDNYNRTVLMKAVDKDNKFQQVALIKLLIESGADVNAKDNLGYSALMKALIKGDEAIIDVLKDAGASLSKEDSIKVQNIIMKAVGKRERHFERLKRATLIGLPKKNVKVSKNIADTDKAAKSNETENVPKKEINETARPDSERTMLKAELFKAIKSHGGLLRIKELIQKGADVNSTDNYQRTALMKTVDRYNQFQQTAIIKQLIDSGADINARDKLGYSALMRAIVKGNQKIISILKDAGATITESDLLEVEKRRMEAEEKRLMLHKGLQKDKMQ